MGLKEASLSLGTLIFDSPNKVLIFLLEKPIRELDEDVFSCFSYLRGVSNSPNRIASIPRFCNYPLALYSLNV